MRRIVPGLAVLVMALGLATFPRLLTSRTTAGPDFVHFESAHVHPIDKTPSGNRLVVVNTADNRLSVFDITGVTPVRIAEIPVGMEPVSVRCKNDSTAWVVNQLSDDISVVDLNVQHVRATIRTGDEPMDVIFSGPSSKAYVTVAGEDVVKVYDSTTLALTNTIAIKGSRPRSLAKSADGSKVYVAIFDAGNRTTVMGPEKVAADSMPTGLGFGNGGDFEFPRNGGLPTPPHVGLIVLQASFDQNYYDMWGNLWTNRVKYKPFEQDVAVINTTSNTVTTAYGDLGSNNFAIAVNPFDGKLAVASTLARNEQRFEPRLNAYLVETNMYFITTGGTKTLRVLNPQITTYFTNPNGTQAERDSALGIPTGIAADVNAAGDTARMYVTSLATNKIGVLNPNAAGAPSMVRGRIPTVEGPTGVAVDRTGNRLFVVGRFRNQLQTLNLSTFASINVASIGFDPTPDEVVNGRRFLYGGFTSGHGDQSCASCHVFGDTDNISWNLGDPTGNFENGLPPLEGNDPEKGPMMTQTLRGHINTGKLHWRADRNNFSSFNGAFVALMGLVSQLPDSQMTAFRDFASALVFPPNPKQHLDRSYATAPLGQPSAARGATLFQTLPVGAGGETCNDCHTATNFGSGTNGTIIPDDSLLHNNAFQDQDLKVPHLRNLYTKTGFKDSTGNFNKRGFGYGHDGATDNLNTFLSKPGFTLGATGGQADSNRADLVAYLLSFDTGMSPAVGRQLTFDGTNNEDSDAIATLDSLIDQAHIGYLGLIAKGRIAGQARGFEYLGADRWRPDRASELQLTTAQLRALGGVGSELTVTGVPGMSGNRMGVDRDRDGFLDRDELDNGSDPGDPASTPNLAAIDDAASGRASFSIGPNPFRESTEIRFALSQKGEVDATVYDIMGREVSRLANGRLLDAGAWTLRWDGRWSNGRAAGPGVYFVRVKTPQQTWNRTVVRLR
jgi:YVTN family beta-propeller protein